MVLALSGLALVVVWLAVRGRAEPRAAAATTASSRAEPSARQSLPRNEPARTPFAASTVPGRKPGPWIERIDVDKTEVCYGEENFATVRAYDASGASDRLIVRLSGSREMGFRLPFRIGKSDAMRTRHVLVTGPGGPPATAEIPNVTVKDCEVAEQVAIGVQVQPRSPHVLALSAEVSSGTEATAEKFEPFSYEWDFGDGSSQITEQAEVEHSYEGASAKTRFSYFLMQVKVKDRRGREVVGSRAYGFPNFGFGAFVDNQQILVHSAGGSMEGERASGEPVRLYHGYEEAVRLERVRSTEVLRSGNRELSSEEHSAEALLGVSELPPGKSTATRDLDALRPSEPDRVRKLELMGRAGSVEARGTIILTSAASTTGGTPLEAAEATPGGSFQQQSSPGE
jgi:hypothetical protein